MLDPGWWEGTCCFALTAVGQTHSLRHGRRTSRRSWHLPCAVCRCPRFGRARLSSASFFASSGGPGNRPCRPCGCSCCCSSRRRPCVNAAEKELKLSPAGASPAPRRGICCCSTGRCHITTPREPVFINGGNNPPAAGWQRGQRTGSSDASPPRYACSSFLLKGLSQCSCGRGFCGLGRGRNIQISQSDFAQHVVYQ